MLDRIGLTFFNRDQDPSVEIGGEAKAGEELEIRGLVDTWGAQENFGGFIDEVERGHVGLPVHEVEHVICINLGSKR